ncbi:4-hydroxyphenylpyruvate dioxygenase [Streptomyces albus subsp. chlorinus]|uniref:4-hydroxyphenylpyruvate dioxygenase n=1 Tax=Streptomyces albus TaxID=1888 RepID=UPI00156E54F0|nr:4-hydroxyphenylpyruvate dioxygenase [Streptomyces albus]NSC25284.1 4-hydroxyphenylpyruvate dioxygenase [Streptomyces albus subsp. chlorinus]
MKPTPLDATSTAEALPGRTETRPGEGTGPAADARPESGTRPWDITGIDHIRLSVGNARQATHFYVSAFGMEPTACRRPENSPHGHAEYVLTSGDVRFVVTGGGEPDSPATRWAAVHGDGVSDIALTVGNLDEGLAHAVRAGAEVLAEPEEHEDRFGTVRTAAIAAYGELRHTLVERRSYSGPFLPGFEAPAPGGPRPAGPRLFHRIDHVVGCVELGLLDQWVDFYRRTMGFSTMAEFVGDDIATRYSALMSKVVTDGSHKVKLPLNEPAPGRRRSQIDEYLAYHRGPGTQHIALETKDILAATDALRAAGVDFLPTPHTYYDDPELRARIGAVRVDIGELRSRGVLVDRDEDGYLLQIFTRPLVDRPTFFIELIERHGSRGFGKGNFKALFEAVEREQELRGNL